MAGVFAEQQELTRFEPDRLPDNLPVPLDEPENDDDDDDDVLSRIPDGGGSEPDDGNESDGSDDGNESDGSVIEEMEQCGNCEKWRYIDGEVNVKRKEAGKEFVCAFLSMNCRTGCDWCRGSKKTCTCKCPRCKNKKCSCENS